jgi:hypothetical protein
MAPAYGILAASTRWRAFVRVAFIMLAVTHRAPARAAELLVFELPQCTPCLRFERDVGGIYNRTDEGHLAPLKRLALGKPPRQYQFVAPARVAPTFVLVDAGREIGRFEGYASDELFWMSLSTRLRQLAPASVP